ncbi:complement C1q-like protein 4 [Dreissena polymorpha]|uniref:complement C1q-like protein 4 n=1 Tax=Dreissena polymorpha TaxID=45954 RepID=UPI0022656CD1|nr:complement C1q-like protein 4 [Dreissena polymorpha]
MTILCNIIKVKCTGKREQRNNRSKRQVVGTVAFSAYLDHDVTNLGPDHTIQFHGVVLNKGNAYNPNTGIFTVPLDGVYFLTFAAEDYRFHREWLNLVVDGQLFSSTVFGAANGHFVGSNIVLARLTIGQSVWVAVDSRETTGGSLQGDNTERFTTFSGFYLYE